VIVVVSAERRLEVPFDRSVDPDDLDEVTERAASTIYLLRCRAPFDMSDRRLTVLGL